ncbi:MULTISPECIES: hypothetical protein [Pseudomonas]|mgnify:CR=1 FL=1|uniref:3-phosphoglycerate kinase n=1 Tax=Pseudomonas flexibilis TaxID=706570 RepID=A0A0B3BP55_9PSED|nr:MULTISPECIES: hypothetical protein [Pseudomonas]KHL68524.1 hypothetical protein SF06_26720 [Pseudomonas flexibilis]KHO66263.1 hypothetical protein PT85_01410 [Pseudomonas flexibilis]SCY47050.1 hypothetical protein SAMN02927929_02936 [Pseudomonas flexibilis]SIQ96006.1 hypothetical protein SAMN05421672_11286 [Pseudomonas flexibilis]
MFRPLSTLCGLALALPLFAQNAEPEIILHQEGLQIDVQPMGKPLQALDGELLGVRAVKVINHGEQTVVCEFQVPAEVRSTTPPVPFRIAPGAQVVERVPGDYAPGQPYAELRCSHAP